MVSFISHLILCKRNYNLNARIIKLRIDIKKAFGNFHASLKLLVQYIYLALLNCPFQTLFPGFFRKPCQKGVPMG